MNSTLFANLLVIAAAPVANAPLSITVTRKGRQTLAAHDAPVPRLRRRSVAVEAAPLGDPACYPSDAEFAAMEAEAEDAYRAQFPPVAASNEYPTLAERLAADLRADRYDG